MPKLKRRADGNYCVSLSVGKDRNGKPKRKYFYSKVSQKDAIAKRNAWMREHPYGEEEEVSERLEGLTVRQWANRWLEAYKGAMASNTQINYESNSNMICAYTYASGVKLGDMLLEDVKPLHIQEFFNSLNGYSKATISLRRLTIEQIFNSAVENGLIEKSPVGKMPKLQGSYEGHKALTREEINAIGKHWKGHTYGLPAMVMLWAGLRIGEASALKWENVDLNQGIIHVTEGRDLLKKTDGRTKTNASVRDVPIFPQLHVALSSVPKDKRTGYVVTTQDGQPFSRATAPNLCKTFCSFLSKQAENEIVFTAHDLRTTFATVCYDAGVDVQTTARWMGHSNVNTTMQIYTKLSKEQYTDSIAKMELFSQQITGTLTVVK